MNAIVSSMLAKYPELDVCVDDIYSAFDMLKHCYETEGKLLVCGNGGSAADSEHIVGELMKGFMLQRPIPNSFRETLVGLYDSEGERLADGLQGALPAISLTSQTAFMTAYANDVSAENVFAQQVYGYGRENDILLGISTSGNSLNVVRAAQVAKALNMRTIALTGRTGGELAKICDVTIRVPYDRTPDIQERHLPIYHTLCIMIEEAFFKE